MYNYEELTTAIQDYTENQTEETFTKNIPLFIKLAEERIVKSVQLQVWRRMIQTSCVGKDRFIAKPCDWLATYSIDLEPHDTDNSNTVPAPEGELVTLINKDRTFIKDYWPDFTKVGTPKYYADHDEDNYILAPTPEFNGLVNINYLRRPTSIVDSTTGTTWLGNNAGDTLLWGCMVEAYNYMKGEMELLASYEARFQESLGRLKNHGEAMEPDDSYRRSFIRHLSS